MQREIRVGLLVIVALLVLAGGILMVGEQSNLFSSKSRYTIQFATVEGLTTGNPVQLNGVDVGQVEAIRLPEDPEEEMLTVRIDIESRYSERVRSDSQAKIKTLGLLGDKYVEITSGSPGEPVIPSGGEIPAAPATDVDKLIASGGDLMDNVLAVSVSLRSILSRMEQGEGLLGLLAVDTPTGAATKESFLAVMESAEAITGRIEAGEGTLGMLVTDPGLGRSLQGSAERLDTLLTSLESGDGLLPALIADASMRQRTEETLARIESAADDLAELSARLADGDGLLPRLLEDEEYGEQVAADLAAFAERLRSVAEKLDRGDGTAARLLEDPAVYQAIEDILVGVEESALLRWLFRNRQREGIEQRYEAVRGADGPAGGEQPDGRPD